LLDSYEEPLIFIQLRDIEILGYSKQQNKVVSKKPRIIFRDSRIQKLSQRYSSSVFNLWQAKEPRLSYNMKQRIQNGDMNPKWMVLFTSLENKNEKIEVFESGLTLTGLHFSQEEGKAGNYIEAHYSESKNVTLSYCEVDLKKSTLQLYEAFMLTFESYNFIIKHSNFILRG